MVDRTKHVDISRIRKFLEESGLDAILVSSPESLPSMSAFYHWDLTVFREFPHYVLWPAKGDPCFVGPERRGYVRRSPIISDHRSYIHDIQRKGNESWRSLETTPVQLIAAAIRERGLSEGRIGVEMRHFSFGSALELQQLCPSITFEDCERVLDRIRAVKTPAEIGILRRAASATDKAITLGFALARCGDSGKDVRDRILSLLLRFGASGVTHGTLCSGERCRMPDREDGRDDRLQIGDLVAADFGGYFEGYCADMARMAVVGHPTRRQADVYSRLAHAHFTAIERITAGLPVKEVVRIVKEQLETVKLSTPYRMFGHATGVSVHEWPVITLYSDAVLESDMVLSFENMTVDPETRERFVMEDVILIGESKAERLSNFSSPEKMVCISPD